MALCGVLHVAREGADSKVNVRAAAARSVRRLPMREVKGLEGSSAGSDSSLGPMLALVSRGFVTCLHLAVL